MAIIPAFFAIGVILGVSGKLPVNLVSPEWSSYALYLVMFLAGTGIGADRKSWHLLRSINLKIFLVPMGIIVGTLLGVALASLLLPSLHLREALAVGAGFGYYSLSAIFISELHSETLGLVALLSNMFREIFTLLLTPLFVKYFGKIHLC